MDIQEKKLASRLLYLPLDVHEKVLLWLTHRGLKPVSEITVDRRNYSQLRKGIFKSSHDDKGPKIEKIRKWINDADLFYAVEDNYSTSWHVGKDKEKVILSSKIIRQFDYENEYNSGILFGFPKSSATAYAKNRVKEDSVAIVWPGQMSSHPYLKSRYYLPYIFYAIRADRIKTDSVPAKLWADTIRKEIPRLASWHEKSFKTSLTTL